MAILVRSQFRNDLKVRMGVLAIVPLTLIYLFMGLRDGNGNAVTGEGLSMVTLAVLMFPAILKANLERSDGFRACWIFFVSPADRTRLVRSSTNVLVAFFVIPYLVLVGATLAYFTHSLVYATTYVVLAGLLSHLALLVVTFADPEIPFSKPLEKGALTGRLLLFVIGLGVLSAFFPFVSRLLERSTIATVAALALAIAVSFLVNYLTRFRIERQVGNLEFHS